MDMHSSSHDRANAKKAWDDRETRRLCWIGAALLTAGALLLLALVEGGWAPLRSADRSVAHTLHEIAVTEPAWTRTNRILTDWAWDTVTMRLLAVAALLALALRRSWQLVLWVAVTVVTGALVQAVVKTVTARPRPRFPDPVDSASYWAFPSGHAMTTTVVCGVLLTLFLLYGKRRPCAWAPGLVVSAWAVAVVSVAGVGFTRVFLGVHWWTDVVAGWLLGGAVLATCSAALAPWRAVSFEKASDGHGHLEGQSLPDTGARTAPRHGPLE